MIHVETHFLASQRNQKAFYYTLMGFVASVLHLFSKYFIFISVCGKWKWFSGDFTLQEASNQGSLLFLMIFNEET